MSQTVCIQTFRGDTVQCILQSCSSPKGVLITAAGAGGGPGPGGSDGPYSLYRKLSENLPCKYSLSVLQVIYHVFSDMQAAVDDILAAIDYVRNTIGSVNIVLIGWSMGGAAVVEAAYQRGKTITGVITIGGQTVGGENANKLHPETAFAILHGMNDTCISPAAANHFYVMAGGASKKNLMLKLFPGEDHGIQGAWDFLVSGPRPYLGHLFCISEESWKSGKMIEGRVIAPTFEQEPSSKEFYILYGGQLITIPYQDLGNIRVGDIKQWFAENYGLARENQEYIFNGIILQNHSSLEEAGIQSKSTIRLQSISS